MNGNQGSEDIPEISRDEMDTTLKKMKNNSSRGCYGAVTVAIKMRRPEMIGNIQKFFNLWMWNQNRIDWRQNWIGTKLVFAPSSVQMMWWNCIIDIAT